LTFTSSATTAPENISVSTTSAGKSIVMAAASPTGKCYYIADIEDRSSALVTGSPITGAGTWYASAASPGGGCVASSPASNWQQNGFPPA
jgi:hypothetical protein